MKIDIHFTRSEENEAARVSKLLRTVFPLKTDDINFINVPEKTTQKTSEVRTEDEK